MIEIRLDDEHVSENVKAVRYLQQMGRYSEEEIQRLYDEQIKKDKAAAAE